MARKIAGIKARIGRSNSGIDLSRDTSSPQMRGLGISNGLIGSIPVGQE